MASKNVVSLTVHRNTLPKRQARQTSNEMTAAARKMSRDNRVIAYAVVVCTDDGRWLAAWDTGKHIPLRAFPYAVADALVSDQVGVAEDFKAK